MGLKDLFFWHKKSATTAEQVRAAMHGDQLYSDTLTEAEGLAFYQSVAPVGNAVNLIADNLKTLEILLWNATLGKFISRRDKLNSVQADFFTLMEKPNPTQTYEEFVKELSVNYSCAGNAYILALGDIKSAPTELWSVLPTAVSLVMTSGDPIPTAYRVSKSNGGHELFERRITAYGQRYLTADAQRELFHFKNIALNKSDPKGISPLAEIKKEILQYKKANEHNLSLLENGAYLGGILGVNILKPEEKNKIIEQFKQKYSGSRKSGQTAVLNTSDFDYKELGRSSADIQFRDLRNDNRKIIYTAFKIPLPLISEDAATFANYQEATFKLYDNCVLPAANYFFGGLTDLLMPRFRLIGYEIWYNEAEITALAERRAKNFETAKNTGVYTINELRALINLPDYEAEADVLYQPNTLVPVGYMPQTYTQLSANTARQRFTAIMEGQTGADGKRKFTDAEINKIADTEGLK
jgi:HK97 family phage portal protein